MNCQQQKHLLEAAKQNHNFIWYIYRKKDKETKLETKNQCLTHWEQNRWQLSLMRSRPIICTAPSQQIGYTIIVSRHHIEWDIPAPPNKILNPTNCIPMHMPIYLLFHRFLSCVCCIPAVRFTHHTTIAKIPTDFQTPLNSKSSALTESPCSKKKKMLHVTVVKHKLPGD